MSQFNNTHAVTTLQHLPIPVLLVTETGQIIAANDKAVHWLCEQLQVCESVDNQNLCHLLDKKKVRKKIEKACQKQKHKSHEFSFKPDGFDLKYHFHMEVSPTPNLENGSENGENPTATYAIVTIQDITSIKRNDKMRKDFIANISHELRTPLTSIRGFIETLQTSAKNDKNAQEKFLSIMAEQAGQMTALLEGVMHLSILENQRHQWPTDSIAIAPIITSVCNGLSLQAKDKNITVAQHTDNNHCVIGNELAILRVFDNVIENAIKYGIDGGEVTITSDSKTIDGIPYIGIHIVDNGEGVDPKYLGRLTERFFRVEKSRSKSVSGTGLGLAIVKHTITQHRGLLDIESQPREGDTAGGTTVHIYLPVTTAGDIS